MTGSRAYSRMVKAAAVLLAAEVALIAPWYVDAASTSARSTVYVAAPASSLGAVSVFSLGIPAPANSTQAKIITVVPQMRAALAPFANASGGMQPAVFSISGQPNQTFAVLMPAPGVTARAGGVVEFVKFAHSAGPTPTVGSTGNAMFAVGAEVKFSPVDSLVMETQSDAPSAGAPADTAAPVTAADKAGLPKTNPFGIQALEDGFLSVLVSYN